MGTPEPHYLTMPLHISENSTASALSYPERIHRKRVFSSRRRDGTSNGQNSQNDLWLAAKPYISTTRWGFASSITRI